MVLDKAVPQKHFTDYQNQMVSSLKIHNIDFYYNFRTTDKNFLIQTSIYSDRDSPLINLEQINRKNFPTDHSVELEKKIVSEFSEIPGIFRLLEKKKKIEQTIGIMNQVSTKKRPASQG